MSLKTILKKTVENKLSFLAALVIGTLIGTYLPSFGKPLGDIGDLFVNILKMCVLPIVITSISLSIAHFMLSKINQSVVKILLIMSLALVVCSVIGAGTAHFLKPGSHIDPSRSEAVKKLVDDAAQTQLAIDEPLEVRLSSGTLEILLNVIPSNIFGALASNSILQIIIFSIIFGIALGSFSDKESHLINLIRQVLEIFTEIFEAIAHFFPLILMLLLARDIAEVGPDILITMGSFVAKFYVAVLILFIICSIIITVRTRTSYLQSFAIMQNPIIIALATQSSAAAIPPSITAMRRFNFDDNLIKLLIPLGSIIGRFGNILYFGFCAVFALQLYGIDLSPLQFVLVLGITIIAGIATAGQSGELSLSALAIVLTPVGIPITGILPLLQAVDTLVNPARTLSIVHTNCAALALITKPHGPPRSLEEVQSEEQEEGE
jgi:proton glutamate symport protein